MKIMTLGINYSTKKLLIDPMNEQSFGIAIISPVPYEDYFRASSSLPIRSG
jgi:hypothetical protein